LDSKNRIADAQGAYESAYAIAQDAIAQLSHSRVGPSENLVCALNNAAKYLMSLAEFRDCSISDPLAMACENWRQAMKLAERLEILDEAEEARTNLNCYC
jgi:hypothetical protein